MRRTQIHIAILLLVLFASACSPTHQAHDLSVFHESRDFPVLESRSGVASYYADKFHGRTTANGEVYNQNYLTAAHRTYPFGTVVRVTSEKNGKSVIVRINDRGPRYRSRIIDLSYAAAQELQMLRSGITKVTVEVLSWGEK
ncbi:MAG: septal ring lytic transglycosylase RlpA family lipoprotein [Ectothiorhodospiraceae bacterium]|nr:septal ring lytic transglycosylase RlpA family lipoprotein [Ectothiorhodospiraceae bacterium]